MTSPLMTLDEIVAEHSIARACLERFMKREARPFPKPVKGVRTPKNAKVWRRADVESWMAAEFGGSMGGEEAISPLLEAAHGMR